MRYELGISLTTKRCRMDSRAGGRKVVQLQVLFRAQRKPPIVVGFSFVVFRIISAPTCRNTKVTIL